MSTVDNQVKFDVPYTYIKLRPGEKILDRLENIEDTKGNGGDLGRLFITNLRIIWHLLSSANINLSIGLHCIVSTNTALVNSVLKGRTEALHIITTYANSKFEFIFTNMVSGSARHFTSITTVHNAYMASKLYRELRLRTNIIQHGQLNVLANEQIFSNIPGIWNLSSDQGNLGTLIVTNIRLVWFADVNEYFNITLPYLQIDSINVKESKFGMTLIVTSTESSGGYILGFRLSSLDKLYEIYKEISTLFEVYVNKPNYGVEYNLATKSDKRDATDASVVLESEFVDSEHEISNAFTAYVKDRGNDVLEPIFYPNFGLSIEPVSDGFNPTKLWQVIPS